VYLTTSFNSIFFGFCFLSFRNSEKIREFELEIEIFGDFFSTTRFERGIVIFNSQFASFKLYLNLTFSPVSKVVTD